MVHHSNHARYFERARVHMLRAIGMDYPSLMAQQKHFPLTAMSVEFKKPLRFDEILQIETCVTRLTRVRLNFSYRIFTSLQDEFWQPSAAPREGRPLTTALTEHCCVNDEGKPVDMGDHLFQTLERYLIAEVKS